MARKISAASLDNAKSRYQQVKDILDAAAGDSAADYGGIGRFWELGVERLKVLDLFGVRLIAPEAAAACSACEPNEASGKTKGSRSSASGLIKGLRGEAPFDGGRLPRLPWGGAPVVEP